jgi:hypothetical protein
MQSVKTALDGALAQAEHPQVKDKIQAMDSELGIVLSGLSALQSGDTSQLTEFEDAAGRLEADGNAVDAVCSSL